MRIFFVPALLALLAACGDDGTSDTAHDPQASSATDLPVVRARFLAEGEKIFLDGNLSDRAWSKVRETTVSLQRGIDVRLKAAYDTRFLYLLALWDDPERSMNRLWTYKGGTTWQKTMAEDALLICWAPGSHADAFREQGCALYCHDDRHLNPAKGGVKLIDFWKFGAQTTAWRPQAIDMQLRAGKAHHLRGDSQPAGSGNQLNQSTEYAGPRYFPFRLRGDFERLMFPDNVKEVTLEGLKKISSPNNIGRRVPCDILRPRRGSRGNVRHASRHHEGKAWVVELVRALDTGEDDDLPFSPDPLVPLLFAIAVQNDTEGAGHATSGPVELHFLPPE